MHLQYLWLLQMNRPDFMTGWGGGILMIPSFRFLPPPLHPILPVTLALCTSNPYTPNRKALSQSHFVDDSSHHPLLHSLMCNHSSLGITTNQKHQLSCAPTLISPLLKITPESQIHDVGLQRQQYSLLWDGSSIREDLDAEGNVQIGTLSSGQRSGGRM
ncbi:hypothetical protein BDZ89DRAFT_1071648 [Hymenopellis radicata]|nr:hypothetical protein BDZ89DRAFT_1071648 [Hymenopellis radicata]